jgi:hypothetical protein
MSGSRDMCENLDELPRGFGHGQARRARPLRGERSATELLRALCQRALACAMPSAEDREPICIGGGASNEATPPSQQSLRSVNQL